MSWFLISAIVLTLITVVALVRPLLREAGTNSQNRHQQNIQFAKDRLAELKEQLELKKISENDYEQLKSEIEASLVDDIDLSNESSAEKITENSQTGNSILIAAICGLVPVAALALYLLTGEPKALNLSADSKGQQTNVANSNQNQAAGSPSSQAASINKMVASLEAKMKATPNDQQGWQLLAASYTQLGRHQDAIASYKHLLSLDNTNADYYTGQAEASALAAGGMLQGEPSKLVHQALALDPMQPQALWLAGLAAVQASDNPQAVEYWQKLLPLLSEQPNQQKELQEIIAQTKSQDISATSNTAQTTAAAPTNSIQPSSTPNNSAEPSRINVNVTLAAELLQSVSENDVIFVIAKAHNGPPAPLAVRKITVSQLPVSLTLSDQDAMVQQFAISKFDRIEVSARLSRSGQPMASSGDIESSKVLTTSPHGENVSLKISAVLP